MSSNFEFKIIKDQEETKKIENLQKKVESLIKEKQSQKKKIPKLFFLIPILIIIISLSAWFIIFKQKNKTEEQITQSTISEDNDSLIQEIIPINPTTESISINTTSNLTSSVENIPSTFTTQSNITSTESTISAALDNQILITNLNINQNQSVATTSINTSTVTSSKTITSTPEISLGSEPSAPSKNTKLDIEIKEIGSQKPSQELIVLNFPNLEVLIKELNSESFKNSWLSLIKIQKKAGEIYNIKFLFEGQQVNSNFIKNYFLKPSFIEEKFANNFLEGLGSDYYILIYYTNTRKFPILIFKINNDLQTIPFIRLWDKESLIKDLEKTIFVGLPRGNLIRNFTLTENYEGIDYKIAYFDNDYKLIWTIYKNYLIISTSLSAFKYLIKNF